MSWPFENSLRFVLVSAFALTSVLYCRGAQEHASGEDPTLAKFFQQSGYAGSFVLYDGKAARFIHHDRSRNSRGFLPASTFKIMNSLIALETGVIKDENHALQWDGKKRFLPIWNRNHTLRSAIRHSVVWYYREAARRIGEERMSHMLRKTGYGNGNISAGVDRFWLEGDFRITPMEQIDLLRRLYKGTLPFSTRSMNIVKDIMLVEKKKTHLIRAKTGLSVNGTEVIGWWVGYVEKQGHVYFFATCIESTAFTGKFADARTRITRAILTHLGVLPKSVREKQ